jgi:hypothetical protein
MTETKHTPYTPVSDQDVIDIIKQCERISTAERPNADVGITIPEAYKLALLGKIESQIDDVSYSISLLK